MSNNESKSIIPKSTVLPLALVILVIVFGVIYILVDINAEDKDYKVFDVVTPLLALVISVIGSLYVYNAYKAQQEQIKIQKDEISRNKKDIAFNRAIDLIYKQLETSKVRYKNINKDKFLRFLDYLMKEPRGINNEFIVVYFINFADDILLFYITLNNEFTIYNDILSELDTPERIKLKKIILNNLDTDLVPLLMDVNENYKYIDSNEEWNVKYFNKINLLKKNINKLNEFVFDFDN